MDSITLSVGAAATLLGFIWQVSRLKAEHAARLGHNGATNHLS